MGALGADLVGGRARTDGQDQRRTDVVRIGDHPLQRPRATHRAADDGSDLGDTQCRQRGDIGLHLIADGHQREPRAPRLSVAGE